MRGKSCWRGRRIRDRPPSVGSCLRRGELGSVVSPVPNRQGPGAPCIRDGLRWGELRSVVSHPSAKTRMDGALCICGGLRWGEPGFVVSHPSAKTRMDGARSICAGSRWGEPGSVVSQVPRAGPGALGTSLGGCGSAGQLPLRGASESALRAAANGKCDVVCQLSCLR